MAKTKNIYWKLFISTSSLSAFTFGGGYVIVPLMQKKFVEELKWIDEEEMLNLVAIGQSSPGPIAVNTSIIVGYRMAGILGSLIAVFGTVLPPLIIITIISSLYMSFQESKIITAILQGMQAGVSAIIINVIIDMSLTIIKKRQKIPIILMILSLVATILFNLNIVIILLVCGFVGAISSLYLSNYEGSK